MERTITVKGTAGADIKPDLIELTFDLAYTDPSYKKAIGYMSDALRILNKALRRVGIDNSALKTDRFNISGCQGPARASGSDDEYIITDRLKLRIRPDTDLLSRVLTEIDLTKLDPTITVAFTVSDIRAANEALLRNAARDARNKAEFLCAASGVGLGALIRVEYEERPRDLYSPTVFELEESRYDTALTGFTAPIMPEAIRLREEISFTWEIV